MKPSIRKHGDLWVLSRPGYGFCPDTVEEFGSWKAAVGSLRTAPASAAASAERGQFSLSLATSYWGPRRGTIRMEDR